MLFADQVGSTRLLAEIGSDAMLAVRRSLHDILHTAVDNHGGRVFGDMGDGIAAVFDEPADAARAACAMHRRADLTAEAPGPHIELRIGVHVGDVVTLDDGFVGMPIHIAARLCEIAPTGNTATSRLFAHDVAHAVGPSVEIRPFERRLLKGIAEPIDVHLLIDRQRKGDASSLRPTQATRPIPPSPSLLEASAGPVVGRSEQRRQLRELATARNDGPRLALVEGEAGIGKSALLRTVAADLAGTGHACVLGRGDEIQPAPYREFIEVVNHVAPHLSDVAIADHVVRHGTLLTQLSPALAGRHSAITRHVDTEVPARLSAPVLLEGLDQYALAEAFTDLLRSASEHQPLTLFIDDLHWSTPSSLGLLRHLLKSTDLSALTAIASFRSETLEEDVPLASFLGRIAADPNVTRMRLGPLRLTDVRTLVDDHPFARVAEQLHRQTGGNALFVSEMIRSAERNEQLTLTDDGTLAVPDTVQELAADRVNRLGPAHRSLLADASVLGPSFELWHLEAITPRHIDVLATLEEAEQASVIAPDPVDDESYVFQHALIRDALYQRISAPRRRRRHSAAADALLAADPETIRRRAAEALRHIGQSRQPRAPQTIADLARDAAQNALAGLDIDEAIRYRRLVVDSLRQIDDRSPELLGEQVEALIDLGATQTSAGLDDGRSTFVEAAELARSIERWDLLSDAACRYGGPVKENQAILDISEPETLIRSALEHETGDTAMRARLLTALATWQRQHVRFSERRRLTDEALRVAQFTEDPATIAAVLAEVHRALHGPMFTMEAQEASRELERMAAELGDDLIALQSHNLGLQAAFELGEWEETELHLQRLEALGDRLTTIEVRRLSLLWKATKASLRGDDQGHRQHSRALAKLIASFPPSVRTVMLGASAIMLSWFRGESAQLYELAGDFGPASLKALLAADSGQIDKARAHAAAMGGVERLLEDQNYLFFLGAVALTRTALHSQDAALAAEVHDALLPYSGRNARMGLVAFLGSVDHHLGTLATLLGRPDDAIRHLTKALDRHRAMGARPWVALTLAELSIAAGPEKGADDAAEARAIAGELELKMVLDLLDVDRVAPVS